MEVVYTMEPIKGRWPEHSRIARETLKAVIEESILPKGLVASYTLAEDTDFLFPRKKPDMLKMKDFFSPISDYNLIAREIDELFEKPQRELAKHEADLKTELETATDEQILKMVETFHYSRMTRERYDAAVARSKEPLNFCRIATVDKVDQVMRFLGDTTVRHELLSALEILDDAQVRDFIAESNLVQGLLRSGQKDKAIKKVIECYDDWKTNHLARFYYACGKASHYGRGFWIARLVPETEKPWKDEYTLENLLTHKNMPFQVVEVPESMKPTETDKDNSKIIV